MTARQCPDYKRTLPASHIGAKCPAYQEKALAKTAGTSDLHYNINDLAALLGLTNEEQARRLSRAGKIPGRVPLVREHLYFRETIDRWVGQHQIVPKQPANPLQEEAKSKCDGKDHSWLSEGRFDGIAYASEDTAIQRSDNTVASGQNRTCYFCGYSTFVSSLCNY